MRLPSVIAGCRFLALPLLALAAVATAPAADADAREKARQELHAIGGELLKLSKAFNLVHEVVAPSVVAIHTRAKEIVPVRTPFGILGYGSGNEVEVGEGSGFIFASDDKASYILTNSHVVLRMNDQGRFERDRKGNFLKYERITVELNEGQEADAEYVGISVETDLAVLKIPLPRLPAVDWADSDKVHVGDWVLALGYPLGVGYSATSGIISATDRSTGIYKEENGYESFIQTDAAINPGNSGGPLVDISGRIIGVNSNILSRTGSNIGLGFAIPSNLAHRVADDLLRTGEVRWPGIGVELIAVAPEQSTSLGLPGMPAVSLKYVQKDAPAERAGLAVGDVVLAVGGVRIGSMKQFRARLAAYRIGQEVPLTVWRDGKAIDKVVVPIDLADIKFDGLELKGFGMKLIEDGQPGLRITEVDPRGLAFQARLSEGDRVLAEAKIGPLSSIADAAGLNRRQEVLLTVYLAKEDRTIQLRMRR